MAARLASDLLIQIIVLFHILQIGSPEPTGFESSVTNFLPLPCPFWKALSAAPASAGRRGEGSSPSLCWLPGVSFVNAASF